MSDITCIAPEPFQLKPVVSDILRTRYCVPGSIFLVEGIDTVYTSRSKRWRSMRLLLGDGELGIQALLSTEMHGFADRGEIAFGSYVKLEQFRLEWVDPSIDSTSVLSAESGKNTAGASPEGRDWVPYLVVEDLVLVGWNNALVDLIEDSNTENAIAAPQEADEAAEPVRDVETQKGLEGGKNGDDDNDTGLPQEPADADDDFEVMPISEQRTTQNRNHLATGPGAKVSREAPTSGYLPWLSNDLAKPLKLTKLRSIPNLPYKQNWSVNILAVVSAISDVEPSGLPPYRQRQARLADPSTDKHVLLTVFLDPHQFAPSIGSVVLLLGVKNHRFDGGSLKKYESDRPKAGDRWWFENPTELTWCDVAGLDSWWRGS